MKNDPVKNTRAVSMLLEYAEILEKEVLELRALACDKAGKARYIRKLISVEQQQEVLDQAAADDAWSLSKDGLIDFISDKKVNSK